MKKQYIQPTTMVVRIKLNNSLLLASGPLDETGAKVSNRAAGSGENLSRGGRFRANDTMWDEEE